MNKQAPDPEGILLKLLDIVGFSSDKHKFINEFLTNIKLEALLNLAESLPGDRKQKLKELAHSSTDPEKVIDNLRGYFSESEIEHEIQEVSQNAIKKYIEAISQTLSSSQKDQLLNFAKQLQDQPEILPNYKASI